jgi:hypothetical protein
VDNHFYDFARDPELLAKLKKMLSSVNGRAVSKWVDSIDRIIERKVWNRPKSLISEICLSFCSAVCRRRSFGLFCRS